MALFAAGVVPAAIRIVYITPDLGCEGAESFPFCHSLRLLHFSTFPLYEVHTAGYQFVCVVVAPIRFIIKNH